MSSLSLFGNTTTAAPSVLTTSLPTFTTEYCFTAPAACPTSAWIATYTIQQVCTGDQATWVPPAIPPNFVTTVVTCNACATPTQTITCPASVQTGGATVWGNGVTAASPATATLDTWWSGILLTQGAGAASTPSQVASSKPTYVQTAGAAAIWKNLAVLSGAMTVAVGLFLWQ